MKRLSPKLSLAAAVGLALVGASAGTAAADEGVRAQAAKILARFASEPDVVTVQEVAARYARLHPEAYSGWVAAANWSAILPEAVEGRIRSWNTDDRDVRTVSTTSSLSTLRALQDQTRFELMARWDFSKMIFNPMKVTASKEVARVAGLREDLLTTVNKLYFARREIQTDVEINPPADVSRAIRLQLRIDALSADLDALTGGWFSQQVARGEAQGPPPSLMGPPVAPTRPGVGNP